MANLHEKLANQIPGLRKELHAVAKEHGTEVISEVTVSQVMGGMRGVKGMLCDTSVVDPDKGLIVRGIPIGELAGRLPEEIFYLLLTGDNPEPCRSRRPPEETCGRALRYRPTCGTC